MWLSVKPMPDRREQSETSKQISTVVEASEVNGMDIDCKLLVDHYVSKCLRRLPVREKMNVIANPFQ